jgi:hypothetical protein
MIMAEITEGIRPMATIRRITELNPIPGADRINWDSYADYKLVEDK